MDGMGALALEFLILNASRTGEVIGGLRKEVAGDVWTIPESRTKAFKEHQVALCSRSIDILEIIKVHELMVLEKRKMHVNAFHEAIKSTIKA